MDFEFKETLLYVENLSVAYGDTVIIKDINLTILVYLIYNFLYNFNDK